MEAPKNKITALLTLIFFLFTIQVSAFSGIDTVRIAKGTIVNVLETGNMSSWGSPIYIIVEGSLRFPVSGVYLNLPEGSSIMLKKGGEITANDVSRYDANGILIGGVMVWQKEILAKKQPIQLTDRTKIEPDSGEAYYKSYALDELNDALE